MGKKWIKDEINEQLEHFNIEYTLEALENDVLINDALVQYGIDTTRLLEDIFKKVKDQYEAFRTQYSEPEIKNVLLVFVRYRQLAELLRMPGIETQVKEWLVKQRNNATIVRSTNPLPGM